MLRIKTKKLHENAQIPVFKTTGACAADIYCTEVELLDRNREVIDIWDQHFPTLDTMFVRYKLGLAFEIPEGYGMLLLPRSSIIEKDLDLTNCVGLIDTDYRGEISAVFRLQKPGYGIYKVGERCCQLLIIEVPKVSFIESNELSETTRGTGGYGSTGNS